MSPRSYVWPYDAKRGREGDDQEISYHRAGGAGEMIVEVPYRTLCQHLFWAGKSFLFGLLASGAAWAACGLVLLRVSLMPTVKWREYPYPEGVRRQTLVQCVRVEKKEKPLSFGAVFVPVQSAFRFRTEGSSWLGETQKQTRGGAVGSGENEAGNRRAMRIPNSWGEATWELSGGMPRE